MREALTQYIKHLEEQEKSKATIAKYTYDIKVFCCWLQTQQGAADIHVKAVRAAEASSASATSAATGAGVGTSTPATLTKAAVVSYKQWLVAHYAPASVNSMLAALSAFLTFIGRQDCKVRVLKIQRPLFYPEEKELSRAEYFRLLNTARSRSKVLYLIMQTLCGAGLRVSELQFVTVESLRTGRVEVVCKGKRRIALLPQTLCKKLQRYTRTKHIHTGAVFVTAGGMPIDRSHIWAAMKKLCTQADVCAKKVFPHNLRHLFARTYYNASKDITRLADLLGHSNINTTRIYTLTDGRQQVQQIEKLRLIQ